MTWLADTRGMALVATLAFVAVVLAAVLALNRVAGDQAVTARYTHDRFLARELAMAGIHLGMAVLVADAEKTQLDSIQEAWADPNTLAGLASDLGLDGDNLTVTIEDELGKIQMNALIKGFPGHQINWDQKFLWQKFVQLYGAKDVAGNKPDANAVINCAKDWLDSMDDDRVTGLSGAETPDYLRQAIPYRAANRPFNHPLEIYSLKNIPRPLLKQADGQKMDAVDYLTIYGMAAQKSKEKKVYFPGRINLNTAPEEVLAALLPEGMAQMAADLAAFRSHKGSRNQTYLNVLDKGWYEGIVSFSEREMDDFDRVIRYASDVFAITSTGSRNRIRVILRAVVKRKKTDTWTCRIIRLERKN